MLVPTDPYSPEELSGQVEHLLTCPPNGYLGQSYGVQPKALLQTPMASGVANDLVEKIRIDVPATRVLGSGGVNLYAFDSSPTQKTVVIEVGGSLIGVPAA